MPQAARSRSRAPIVFLLLALLALPAFAGEQEGTRPSGERGFLASLWLALAELVPEMAQLGPGLDPLGGNQAPGGDQGDLGPSLDPLG